MNGTSAAAAAAAATARAIKASGAIVSVEPADFVTILAKTKAPLVVQSQGGVFATKYSYLTSYKGLAFFTKTPAPLQLPGDLELIVAKKIWIPD